MSTPDAESSTSSTQAPWNDALPPARDRHEKDGKDGENTRDIIAVQGVDAFDWDYIHRWTEDHGTRELLDEIRASIPPID